MSAMPSGPTAASASTSPDQKPESVLPNCRYPARYRNCRCTGADLLAGASLPLLEVLHVNSGNPEPPWFPAGAASCGGVRLGVTGLNGGGGSTVRVVHVDVRARSLPCSSLAALSDLCPV